MSRPHEDRQQHTLVDHRPGGPRVSFEPGCWCAVEIASVRADRTDAVASAYETLIEKHRAAQPAPQSSAVLRSTDHRRVVALLELRGHAEFRHLAAAWDDHHLYSEHRAHAESSGLALYRAVDAAGDAGIDPASTDSYEFERVAQPSSRVTGLFETLVAAPGFRGGLILSSDDEIASVLVYRFEHRAEFEAFRSSEPAVASLGRLGASGESRFAVHPVKTFGVGA